jgi:N-glycosylase/DNA lyase
MLPLPRDLLTALQARAARGFLCEIDLRAFRTPNPSHFRTVLDETTERLLHAFPEEARHWGLARKGLNLFLREGALPPWGTVRDLTPEVSDAFQAVAARIAEERGIARVHLDAIWWGQA